MVPVQLCAFVVMLMALGAAGQCEVGWTSRMYTSGSEFEGFRVSHPGLITFGSSASVLGQGGSGSFLLESALEYTEIKINKLQFNLQNARDFDIEVGYFDNGHHYAVEYHVVNLPDAPITVSFDSSSTLVIPIATSPDDLHEPLTFSQYTGNLDIQSLVIRIHDIYNSRETSRARLEGINLELCTRKLPVDHIGYREICSPATSDEKLGCYNGGTCIVNNDEGGYRCDCREGYFGDHCEQLLAETDVEGNVMGTRSSATTHYTHTVCEGDEFQFRCPSGYEIVIEDAIFGRNDSSTCVHSYNDLFTDGDRCITPGVMETLSDLCDGKQTCEGRATVDELDRYRNSECETFVAKKLSVSYVCRQKVYSVLTCEASGQVVLACPKYQHIVVKSAFFGRRVSTICEHESVADYVPCGASNANETFSNLCDGKEKCVIDPRSDVFGDPCPGIYKYMHLEYMCSECVNRHHSDEECEYWANRGNCSNTSWMMDSCYRACSVCKNPNEETCFNVSPDEDCEQWKEDDQCEINPEWMYPNCRRTCLGCDEGTDCYNFDDAECEAMASNDMCRLNLTYMFENCRGACFDCTDNSLGVHYENYYWNQEQCELWALTGECSNNPGFMLTRCLKSCTGLEGPTHCHNIYENDTKCEEWEAEGECVSNPSWMYRECWKACTKCEPREPVCENSWEEEAECYYWRHIGECANEDSKAFMKDNCYRACTRCEPLDEVDDCVNLYPGGDAECNQWMREGECHKNQAWMHFYCRKSCTNCAEDYEGHYYHFGNPALPGEVFEFSKGKTILIESNIKFTGKLTHFTAMFADLNPVTLQIWRRNVNSGRFERRFATTINPRSTNTVETIVVDSDFCINVRPGDRIGFTSRYSAAPIAYSMGEEPDEINDIDVWMKSALTDEPFRRMLRPYKFSIGAGYEPDTVCDNDERGRMTRVTDQVWMDMYIGDEHMGNITLGLFGDIAPLTVQNLVGLMQGSVSNQDGYSGAIFHRVIYNFMMQGGDYLTSAGYGHSCSIWNREFDDETFELLHRCGRVSMANAGPNTNGCQFVIQFVDDAPWLDGKHVVFGVVLDGFDIVRAVENNPTDSSDRPIRTVLMKNTGVIPTSEPYPYWDLDTPVGDCPY